MIVTGGGFKINYNSGQAVKILTNSTGGYMEVGHNVYLSTIDGGVGIGTNTVQPGYKLVVDNGKVGFREVFVKLNGSWPDYVFESQYKLAALSDIEAYIYRHGTLPGMQKATDIAANGLEMAKLFDYNKKKLRKCFCI